MPLISIVVPCYNEQESLPIFLKELDGVVRIMTQQDPGISFEAVLIDDGSADKTLAVMKAEPRRRIHTPSAGTLSRATLARRRHYSPDSSTQRATMSPPWMPTCRTRPRSCRRCTRPCRPKTTTTSPRVGPPAKASLPSGRSVPVCSTRSSTAFPRPTSSTEHAILGS